MSLIPRTYQSEAVEAATKFLSSPKVLDHSMIVLPTGSGKSLVIALICAGLQGKILVFQPSKEILEQNFSKYTSYGFRAGIYSASVGMKFIDKVTFATIGSVANKHHLFRDFDYIIIDECHLVNAEDGMYRDFFNSLKSARILGLTATPYRLTSSMGGAQLKFLTRTSPRVFANILYYVQNATLFNAGYLAKLQYFSFNIINREMLSMNNSGTDYTSASIKALYRNINMPQITAYYAARLLQKRKNLLIFCSLIEEANKVKHLVTGAVVITGATKPAERARILAQFKAGKIKCVVNVGVLTTGFDFPELECVLIARSTMSLAWFYQVVGRVMRIHANKKDGWIVDLGGNVNFFGKIETMVIVKSKRGLYHIENNGKQLTNVAFSKS